MTAAVAAPGIPTWSVDWLTVTGSHQWDEDGREWGVEGGTDKGWSNPAGPRTRREDRPFGHGAYRSTAWRNHRQFTLGGYVGCPTPALREQSEQELSGLCSDPGRLYEFRRRTDSYDQVAMVELDDEPLIELVNIYTVRWQFTFAAPDPRKHDYAWQEPQSTLGRDGTGGLEFTGAGLEFTAGLDFGTPTMPAAAMVHNHGTAPAYPVLGVYGQTNRPQILHVESGLVRSYGADLEIGEALQINCDSFVQKNLPGHSCLSSIRGNVRSLLSGGDWPVVNPGETATFQLLAANGVGSTLTASLRSAWW